MPWLQLFLAPMEEGIGCYWSGEEGFVGLAEVELVLGGWVDFEKSEVKLEMPRELCSLVGTQQGTH